MFENKFHFCDLVDSWWRAYAAVQLKISEALSFLQVRATETENYLVGKDISDGTVLQGALTTLATELVPDYIVGQPDATFKTQVSQSLLYKVNRRPSVNYSIYKVYPNSSNIQRALGATTIFVKSVVELPRYFALLMQQ